MEGLHIIVLEINISHVTSKFNFCGKVDVDVFTCVCSCVIFVIKNTDQGSRVSLVHTGCQNTLSGNSYR